MLHFYGSYKIILKEKVPTAGDDKKRTTDLLTKYDKTKKEWQLGKTKVRVFFLPFGDLKWQSFVQCLISRLFNRLAINCCHLFVLQVFMKESLEQRLEKDRDEVRRQAAMIIRAHLLTFSAK